MHLCVFELSLFRSATWGEIRHQSGSLLSSLLIHLFHFPVLLLLHRPSSLQLSHFPLCLLLSSSPSLTLSRTFFFLLSESLFLSSLPPLSHTTNIEILPFLVKFSNKFSWRPHGGWPSSSCQTNCLTYNLPQVERFLQISCFTSSLLSHSPYHLFITLSILSFYSISNSSPTLQPCKKSLTFTMLAFG